MEKYVDTATIYEEDLRVEDGGCAMYYEFDGFNEDMFVVLHSWNSSGEHKDMESMVGKRVRVTVEVL